MDTVMAFIVSTWESIPPLARALILLPAGWLIARLTRFIVTKLLWLLGTDRVGENARMADFLKKGGVEYSPSRLGGVLAYWAVIIAALVSIAIVLDVQLVASLYEKIVQAFPSVLATILILVIGAVIISFLSTFTMTIARNAASPNSALFARVIKYAGNLLLALVALDQIGLGGTILSTILLVLIGAAALGTALAFGLGCKDLAHDAAVRFLRTMRERNRGSQSSDLEG